MGSFEQEYYEQSHFWGQEHTSPADLERIETVLKAVKSEAQSLLDVGCGDGICCNQATTRRAGLQRVVGFDRSNEALRHVQVEKHVGEISSLPFRNKEFDTTVSLEVLEHLPIATYKAALIEIARVTRDQIIITVPYNEKLRQNFAKCPECSSTFNRNLHMRSFHPDIMPHLFSKYGFSCSEVRGISTSRAIGMGFINSMRLRMKGRRQAMKSAMCPLCGYQDSNIQAQYSQRNSRKSTTRVLLKKFWPKRDVYRWLLAVYHRSTHIADTNQTRIQKAS